MRKRGKADRDAAVKRRKEEMSSKEETQTAEKAVDQTTERADAAPADVKEVGLSIHDERDNMAEEAKTVAVKSTQDLISFSLGAPRDGADVEVDAPESMEIKSTKQVAKAVPVETPSDEAEPLIPPSDAMGSMDADEAEQELAHKAAQNAQHNVAAGGSLGAHKAVGDVTGQSAYQHAHEQGSQQADQRE